MNVVGNLSLFGFLAVAIPVLFLAIFFFGAVRVARRSVREEDRDREP
jgi:hypothetical protein